MNEAQIKSLLTVEQLKIVSDCLRTLSHPVRLRMVQLLIREQYSVGELARHCSVQNHMASEHLRLMQRTGLLISQREGRKIYYSIAMPTLIQLMQCIEKSMDEKENPTTIDQDRR
ncbi:MAG: winged helix-turn-helix transcriptional regulator [Planctomycetes bacterium]|jgi:DNA-binding transcriptional ArsR family regulator|nr:winged helix-turn-helix transcriptional regulator [Planctomycetota bacterium]MBT6452361.1 winged helix-turn-helix transcriptional regulator [Planctomycetota bacterium]MBT6540149.1 winged helix-turn-helix transcriptional regulator [Planctomycetota bacterium]MBT6785272.1 winged helix-turn-helix transcriptional regulator [Planctomycetota bacterium]MBT6968972.1 winged helix-turn-helix transcriptional regulator [Planctomycetota bacterium]